MDATHGVLSRHQRAISELCRRFGVSRLQLFGSAATGRFVAGQSDYNFLIELDPAASGSRAQRLMDLADALEALLGAPVDLVNPRCIRNPRLAAEVERARRPVHQRSPAQAAV